MSAYVEKFIALNPHSRSGLKLDSVKKLVIHYTANPGATAQNHHDYFASLSDRYASAHIFVDKIEAIAIIPMDEVAYHANDVQKRNADGSAYRGVAELKPNANNASLGIELCIEKDGSFHPDTISRAEDVFVQLLKWFKLSENDIVRHYDVTSKNCPAPFVSDEGAFNAFKARVGAKLHPVQVAPSHPIIAQVEVIVDALNIRDGASADAKIIGVAKKDNIYNVTGNINDWHEIIVDDAHKGFVFGNNGKYLSLIK